MGSPIPWDPGSFSNPGSISCYSWFKGTYIFSLGIWKDWPIGTYQDLDAQYSWKPWPIGYKWPFTKM